MLDNCQKWLTYINQPDTVFWNRKISIMQIYSKFQVTFLSLNNCFSAPGKGFIQIGHHLPEYRMPFCVAELQLFFIALILLTFASLYIQLIFKGSEMANLWIQPHSVLLHANCGMEVCHAEKSCLHPSLASNGFATNECIWH